MFFVTESVTSVNPSIVLYLTSSFIKPQIVLFFSLVNDVITIFTIYFWANGHNVIQHWMTGIFMRKVEQNKSHSSKNLLSPDGRHLNIKVIAHYYNSPALSSHGSSKLKLVFGNMDGNVLLNHRVWVPNKSINMWEIFNFRHSLELACAQDLRGP